MHSGYAYSTEENADKKSSKKFAVGDKIPLLKDNLKNNTDALEIHEKEERNEKYLY